MSFHRVVVVALATLFSVGMTSIASASCCGWGYSAPVAYATVASQSVTAAAARAAFALSRKRPRYLQRQWRRRHSSGGSDRGRCRAGVADGFRWTVLQLERLR